MFKDPGGWLNAAESAGPTGTIPKVMAKIGLYPSGGHLVKRVIGVAGDVIECCDDQGRIMVNGQPLDEDSYVKDEGLDVQRPDGQPVLVGLEGRARCPRGASS